jgi:hypothetical protein
MLTTICFQFSMLNIYHQYPYGCHLKGRAIMRPSRVSSYTFAGLPFL